MAKKKKQLKTFNVAVSVCVSSTITVDAKDEDDALHKAELAYRRNWEDSSHHGLECTCTDVDFDIEYDGAEEEEENVD